MTTPESVAELFRYEHLPEHLQAVSRPFYYMALEIVHAYGDLDALSETRVIWDLWEVKNKAVWLEVEKRRLLQA